MKKEEVARLLAEDASKMHRTEITVLERSGIVVANICGSLACKESNTHNNTNDISALAAKDAFGTTHLLHVTNNLLGIQLSTVLRESGRNTFESQRTHVTVGMSGAVAALGFLEGALTKETLAEAEEMKKEIVTTGFHGGEDRSMVRSVRTGWRFPLHEAFGTNVTVNVILGMQPNEGIVADTNTLRS